MTDKNNNKIKMSWFKKHFLNLTVGSILIPILVGALSYSITASYKANLKIEHVESQLKNYNQTSKETLDYYKNEMKTIKQSLFTVMIKQGIPEKEIKELISRNEEMNAPTLKSIDMLAVVNDPTPKPATMMLLAFGLAGLVGLGRKKKVHKTEQC